MPLNLFIPSKIPPDIPRSMELVVNHLRKSRNKEGCLREAYNIISQKYYGERIKTYLLFHRLFINRLNAIWNKDGFLHCTTMNYLLRILLVKSGIFKQEDIKPRWTLVYYTSPHQYLSIKINRNKFINIDLWGKRYGIRFGDYARGFHLRS